MPRTSSDGRVLVFAKAPRPGSVKTRLIPLLGEQGAAALHARLVKRTLSIARLAAPGAVDLYGAPADDAFLRCCAERYGARLLEQSCGDLGVRMRDAFSAALEDGAYAILVGCDCPALVPRDLQAAARALKSGADAVFAPTEDGGYALIGLRRCTPVLFADIRWSSSSVMQDTRERLAALGWSWKELTTTWDVDTPADYRRLVASGMLEPLALEGSRREPHNHP
jgi:rSAM/selenodomain-associated transferase 1